MFNWCHAPWKSFFVASRPFAVGTKQRIRWESDSFSTSQDWFFHGISSWLIWTWTWSCLAGRSTWWISKNIWLWDSLVCIDIVIDVLMFKIKCLKFKFTDTQFLKLYLTISCVVGWFPFQLYLIKLN